MLIRFYILSENVKLLLVSVCNLLNVTHRINTQKMSQLSLRISLFQSQPLLFIKRF